MSKQASTAGARRPAVAGVALMIAAGLIAGGCSSSNNSSSTPAGPVWVCQPGQAADPCASSLAATTVTARGTLQPASWPHSAMASKFDCFYVHGSDVNDDHLNGLAGADTGPAYGYHGYEYGLTLGNLLHDIAGEEAAWQSRH